MFNCKKSLTIACKALHLRSLWESWIRLCHSIGEGILENETFTKTTIYLDMNIFQKQKTKTPSLLFSRKASSQIYDRVLNTALQILGLLLFPFNFRSVVPPMNLTNVIPLMKKRLNPSLLIFHFISMFYISWKILESIKTNSSIRSKWYKDTIENGEISFRLIQFFVYKYIYIYIYTHTSIYLSI